jgi:hypothetical protein
MRPYKKPKYKLDVHKFEAQAIEKKEKDLSFEELYKEQLFSKIRKKRR